MTSRDPERTAARRARSNVYGRRRRGALVGAALVLLLDHAALGSSRSRPSAARHVLNDKDRAGRSWVRWPLRGQAALVLGNGRPAASPHEQPAPIASLAKVMTAYLTLKHCPLSGAQGTITVTETRRRPRPRASRSWRCGPASR